MMEKYAWLAILTLAQIIQFLLMRPKDKGKGRQYNPHPPGQAETCIDHTERLARIEEQIDGQGKRLERIENKMNGKA